MAAGGGGRPPSHQNGPRLGRRRSLFTMVRLFPGPLPLAPRARGTRAGARVHSAGDKDVTRTVGGDDNAVQVLYVLEHLLRHQRAVSRRVVRNDAGAGRVALVADSVDVVRRVEVNVAAQGALVRAERSDWPGLGPDRRQVCVEQGDEAVATVVMVHVAVIRVERRGAEGEVADEVS